MGDRLFLTSGSAAVRPLTEEDAPCLLQWLTDPAVLEWYEGRDTAFTPALIREHFYEFDPEEPEMRRCIVEYEGRPVGYVQVYPLDERGKAEYGLPAGGEKIFAMDQFLGEPERWGKGIGRAFVRLIAEHLVRAEHADAVVLDPHQNNERAIRCYEACGFRKKKELPAHELHEGTWEDCWLMEYRPAKQ